MVFGGEVEVVPDLQREATKAISQEKRSKVVTVGCSKKPAQVVPVRKSDRNKGTLANLSVIEKAQRLVAGKNIETGNNFHILDSQSDDHLASVLLDSCMTFVPSAGTPCEALSLLMAKEKVQATLAKVAAEKELADRAAREAAAASLALSDSAGGACFDG
jgi:hypothetical protein